MANASLFKFRLLIVAMLSLAALALDMSDAYAQSRNCQTLTNTLQSIERNRDYRNYGDAQDNARDLKQEVQDAESAYVRSGCNAAAKRGDPQTSQCRTLARRVLSARADSSKAQQKLETGSAIAQQRESVLQEMARFNCAAGGSSAEVNSRQGRGNLFDQLFGNMFGDGEGGTRGDEFSGYAGYETVRTVCVRKVDGYYWPVSYSTLLDYAPNDLDQCHQQCPNADVDLYYYDNPGQEPDQMRTLSGEPYSSLPTAFAYRTNYDPANSCKANVTYGSITLTALPDGTNRAMIAYGLDSFPLPLTDPRYVTVATVLPVETPAYVDVPLPRPRPAAPGETPAPVVVQQAANDPERIVMFGDKRVRIVGPDTPYAPSEEAGT